MCSRKPQLTRSFMEMSLRDTHVAELRRAFEQLAVQRLTMLIEAITPRAAVPDPEAYRVRAVRIGDAMCVRSRGAARTSDARS